MTEGENEELERIKQEKMKKIMEKRKGPDYPNSPINLTTGDFQNVSEKYPLLVVDFWADWCSACKAMAPILEKLAKKYSGKIVFGKLNIDQDPELARNFQITGIPTMVVFKNGEPVDKIVGMTSMKSLESKLTKHLD